MISTRPAHQVLPGDRIAGISVNKVIHQGIVTADPYPALAGGHIVVSLECHDHGNEALVVPPSKLANVERNR